MQLSDAEMLGRLGDGQPIAAVCEQAGIDRATFDAWWRRIIASRVPAPAGRVRCERFVRLAADVEIVRDRRGVPHVFAGSDADLFFGFGWAMAEDRLFQLDWLRRKAQGRLAEIFGPGGLEYDRVVRTVGISHIAEAEWSRLPAEVQQLVEAFSAGINAVIERCRDNPPVEFDLLRYRPELWRPVDCLAIEGEFRWYLTGRFPVICIPELARRALGDTPLYREFLQGEADEESILHPGDFPTAAERPAEEVGDARDCPAGGSRRQGPGEVTNDPDASVGSNNWVLGGARTATGLPLLASDPHIAFEAVSCWFPVHLCGGSFDVAGIAYAGMPAVMFGRNRRVAWGITNNICSLRDLYQERTDEKHPDCFFFDGRWEPGRTREETIEVRGRESERLTVRHSRNGPIVDAILPRPADRTGPVALKWLGASQGGWLQSLLQADRAGNVSEFREALRPWHVPLFSLVIADDGGRIAYQAAGRIPLRNTPERGYRPGWDPQHQWQGLIPFEEMPALADPPRGWIATANNRLAPPDYPRPLAGCWSSGYRAMRIRELIESRERHTAEDMGAMHRDCAMLRARKARGAVLELLQTSRHPLAATAANAWQQWNGNGDPDSVAATLFNVFFARWKQTVVDQRFDPAAASLLVGGGDGCAARLLEGDAAGWFAPGQREPKLQAALDSTLDYLSERLGPDPQSWAWGRLHRLPLRHVLSARGDLGELLDHGGAAVPGDVTTVCNTGAGADWAAATGAGYRQIVDLHASPPTVLLVDVQSQSGHPGSPHYDDQFDDWLAGRYHPVLLDAETVRRDAAATLTLERVRE